MNTKAKGSKQERRSMKLLESAGYSVTKSGASLGLWDLVAISRTDFVVIQVKSNRQPPPAEREQLEEFRCPSNCRKLIHVWKDYARQPLVKEL